MCAHLCGVALIYKGFEQLADTIELERVVKYDQVTPILASAATGLFYKSTGTLVGWLKWIFSYELLFLL